MLAAAVLSLAACGADTATTPASVGPATPDTNGIVEIEQSRYRPDELRVPVGATVRFENADPFAHTVTARNGDPMRFDSGELGQGARFEVSFDEPGTYRYFCEIHPTMRATIVVGAPD